MIEKSEEKRQAIILRKQGKTYNEILKEVLVSKSTLSLWLREVSLAKPQKQRLTAKKYAAQQRGGEVRRRMRLEEGIDIDTLCKKDIGRLTDRELFLVGVTLYWSEGTKKSGNRVGTMIDFANSDPAMVALFVKWLVEFAEVEKTDIQLRLHLHEGHRYREEDIKKTWSKVTGLSGTSFTKTNYKKHNPSTLRKKVDNTYIGLVSVRVKRSTRLNRRILGWIYAIIATQN